MGSGGQLCEWEMTSFIHRVNQEWIDRHADHSPAELIEALELAGPQVVRQFEGADLDATGLGVSWAGADPAPKWLDVAREFTEYWTHRQQIRHATGRDTDPEPNALSAVLDTFMRALPHTLRHTPAPAGTQLQVVIEEPAGGTWTVTATADRWSLAEEPSGRPTASVRLGPETAWRLCTRGKILAPPSLESASAESASWPKPPARSWPSSTDGRRTSRSIARCGAGCHRGQTYITHSCC